LTPEFKQKGNIIVFIPLSNKKRMGGSILTKVLDLTTVYETPDFENIAQFESIFNTLQLCLSHNLLASGHDVSDGGLITTLTEMCIASQYGCDIAITSDNVNAISPYSVYEYLFNEELGLVYEIEPEKLHRFQQYTKNIIDHIIIGTVTSKKQFKLHYNDKLIMNNSIQVLLDMWQHNCHKLELLQCDEKCVKQEYADARDFNPPKYVYECEVSYEHEAERDNDINHSIIVLREEGSNGDKELIDCFFDSGFHVYEMNMAMLADNIEILDKVNGIAFCGGFSFSDTLGSATGWSTIIKNNEQLNKAFNAFYERTDTFSIGICNGCQLMAKMGWIPDLQLETNNSGRFESRYCNIKVNPTNCIFTKDMEGTIFGMWCAHKEGKIENKTQTNVFAYCDNNGKPTIKYPYNPNGSPGGCAGVCSANGRHLALMPHPERSYHKWQMPWVPADYPQKQNYTPWRQLFTNAYKWIS
jgi:phosphoribosylformylglycinamidine synthase